VEHIEFVGKISRFATVKRRRKVSSLHEGGGGEKKFRVEASPDMRRLRRGGKLPFQSSEKKKVKGSNAWAGKGTTVFSHGTWGEGHNFAAGNKKKQRIIFRTWGRGDGDIYRP